MDSWYKICFNNLNASDVCYLGEYVRISGNLAVLSGMFESNLIIAQHNNSYHVGLF